MPSSFDYAVLRVVPFTEREEFFNAGVVVYCAQERFLAARVALDEQKLTALAPSLRASDVQQRLDAVLKVCTGAVDAGPIGQLSQSARFHWLVAPRSTLIQPSSVHSGICEQPEEALERLFREQVLRSR
jgi:hypothetical protein